MTDQASTDQAQPVAGSMTLKKPNRFAQGARNNADGLGVGLPVVLSWALSTFAGVEIPIEVASAAAAILGSIGAKVKQAL
ncbi:hypothetical protein [Halomonas caseinilytica]|uniref:hypothetical protein n=1 Tax=Halomonas caseinilytica TaxID=438744 RepID=UPI0007E5990B|nr:hypothetical protein [Halomonas caseinilytica]SEN68165.1 hypothetical protein SAMN04487952_12416 [Halomonas caseinilytica]